jgi:hypothetical protein
MNYKIILFFISSSLFANEINFIDLEKEKMGLIEKYYNRVNKAKENHFNDRIVLLSETLNCFILSKSKRDILNCKSIERKKIMDLVRGRNIE